MILRRVIEHVKKQAWAAVASSVYVRTLIDRFLMKGA